MWLIIAIALLCIVVAGCFKYVLYLQHEGLEQYNMLFFKSLSFFVVFTTTVIFYYWIAVFSANAFQKELSWDEAMGIIWTTEGIIDEMLYVLAGLAIAFVLNIRKSNFAFALQYTLGQFLTSFVAVFAVVVMVIGYSKAMERKRGIR